MILSMIYMLGREFEHGILAKALLASNRNKYVLSGAKFNLDPRPNHASIRSGVEVDKPWLEN